MARGEGTHQVGGDRVMARPTVAALDGTVGWADPKEDGVRCYTPAGELIGKIHLPETCANLVFGGPLRNRLYMCASTSVYAAYVNVQGAAVP
jgi:gluconolactonase